MKLKISQTNHEKFPTVCHALLFCIVQIALLTFALVSTASARPQEYDDYDQPSPRSIQQKHNHPHHQQHIRNHRDDETSTVIPIIQYDKEQDISGSYKTQYVDIFMIDEFLGNFKNMFTAMKRAII